MATNTNESRAIDGDRQRARDRGQPARRNPPRPGFHKERATLWLLTVTLGLGLGAAVRFVQRADQARTAAAGAPSSASTRFQANTSVPYQNQRVAVLPQRSFIGRATSRMS